ncbi:DnaJ-domain-containing protein, partial [Nadsonia fulvescens var. elongata DSM 6958]
YDILSLEPTANEQELKKAYKKHALRLHPDRNFQNIEEATKEFAKIQSAYDVLSDPQERAWYDSHTLHADMTKGQETNLAGYTILTTSEDLQKYFDPMLYSTLKNHESDFLSLSELFSNLGYEERELAISFGEKPAAWSLFGNSGSEWKHTKIFYERWTSFSTIKDFYWCDVYRVSDAPDSKTQREMMGLNQRYRDLAKKEYNDTVRSLVKFIKKRDPRVKLVRSEAYEKQNTQNSDSKIQAAKDRHQNKIKLQENVYTEQNWTKTPERKYQPSRSHDSLEILDLENTDDEVINLFECLVCQKKFKTKQQYDGHEKSKKHIKALKNLRWELKKDGLDM